MIATCELEIDGKKDRLEVQEGDALLLFYFRNGVVEPMPFMVGNASAESFIEASLVLLRTISDSVHEELRNGQAQQDSSEG